MYVRTCFLVTCIQKYNQNQSSLIINTRFLKMPLRFYLRSEDIRHSKIRVSRIVLAKVDLKFYFMQYLLLYLDYNNFQHLFGIVLWLSLSSTRKISKKLNFWPLYTPKTFCQKVILKVFSLYFRKIWPYKLDMWLFWSVFPLS